MNTVSGPFALAIAVGCWTFPAIEGYIFSFCGILIIMFMNRSYKGYSKVVANSSSIPISHFGPLNNLPFTIGYFALILVCLIKLRVAFVYPVVVEGLADVFFSPATVLRRHRPSASGLSTDLDQGSHLVHRGRTLLTAEASPHPFWVGEPRKATISNRNVRG